jgi:peptide/nickel transport system permease protein
VISLDSYKRPSFKDFLKGPKFSSFKTTLGILFSKPSSAAGMVVFLIYIAIAIIDSVHPQLLGINSNVGTLLTNFENPTPLPPSRTYPLGTTFPGINLLPAILQSIRLDVAFSFAVVGLGSIIGILLGLFSGYYGGIIDEFVMRITDIVFAIPFLILLIAAGYFIPDGRSIGALVIILTVVWWPRIARVVRGQVLSLKQASFVEAAKACGVNNIKIIFKHIFPNTLAPVTVQISLDIAAVMLLLATLDFLGFIPGGAYVAELGYLASIGISYFVLGDWWTLLFPGLAILFFALSMNLIGDGLRDALDPKLRR